MGYGGFQLEYFDAPNELFNYSLRVLLAGGSADGRTGRREGFVDTTFFAFEPEARITLNVARHFRFGLGVGYRFADANGSGLDLSAPMVSFSFKLGASERAHPEDGRRRPVCGKTTPP